MLEIYKSRTTPYHPQGNGMVERFNQTLKNMVAKTSKDNGKDWDLKLGPLTLAYNASVHDSTGFSPFFLMHGREPRLPLDVIYGTPTPQYWKKAGHYARDIHREVWLLSMVSKDRHRKLALPWEGPYVVRKRIQSATGMPGCTYRIQHETTGKRIVVHHNRLKPFDAPRIPSPLHADRDIRSEQEIVTDTEACPNLFQRQLDLAPVARRGKPLTHLLPRLMQHEPDGRTPTPGHPNRDVPMAPNNECLHVLPNQDAQNGNLRNDVGARETAVHRETQEAAVPANDGAVRPTPNVVTRSGRTVKRPGWMENFVSRIGHRLNLLNDCSK